MKKAYQKVMANIGVGQEKSKNQKIERQKQKTGVFNIKNFIFFFNYITNSEWQRNIFFSIRLLILPPLYDKYLFIRCLGYINRFKQLLFPILNGRIKIAALRKSVEAECVCKTV